MSTTQEILKEMHEHADKMMGGYTDPAPAQSTRQFANFSTALDWIKMGMKARRAGWLAYIEVQRPDALSKMTCMYVYLNMPENERIPWTPTQADLFANDWEAVI